MQLPQAPDRPADDRVIRIGLAEPRALVRRGLARMAHSTDDVVVVGEASDRDGVFDLLRGAADELGEPDVLILDVDMPDAGGFEIARTVCAKYPNVGVVMLGVGEDWREFERAILAGARGYVARAETPHKLIETLKTVAAGGDALAGHRAWLALRDAPLPRRRSRGGLLTERQIDVLRVLRQGIDDESAAAMLGISPAALRAHTRRIAARLEPGGERGDARAYASTHRYVIGRGSDFVGIWDLDHARSPVERYRADLETRAEFRLEQLQAAVGRRDRLRAAFDRTWRLVVGVVDPI